MPQNITMGSYREDKAAGEAVENVMIGEDGSKAGESVLDSVKVTHK